MRIALFLRSWPPSVPRSRSLPLSTARSSGASFRGFYRIARAARVPVALAHIDFPTREIGVGAHLELSGDAEADMARIRAFYAGRRGRHPESQSPIRFEDGA